MSWVHSLTLLFIALKLMEFIDWSWFWVLSPLWLPIVVTMIIGAFYLILKGYKDR